MSRRNSLKILTCGIAAGGAALGPMAALANVGAGTGAVRAVFDGRFAAARAFAAQYSSAQDCQLDAAALWFARLWPQHRPGMVFLGLTTPADAMILADCARREGLRFTAHAAAIGPGDLIAWDIR